MYQVPTRSRPGSHESINQNDEDTIDNHKWGYYRYVNDKTPAWAGLLATTNREKAKLIDIIKDSTTLMYSPGQTIYARQVLQLYDRFMGWRSDLPASIGNIEKNNSQPLPHVLSLLILFSNSVIQLLRPLLDFEGFPSVVIEEILWTHAQQGLLLLDQHYRTQYTCRYQPVLQMFSVLQICDVIARFFPAKIDAQTKDAVEAIQLGLEVLKESRYGYPIAGPLQELLKRSAVEYSVRLPANLDDIMAPPTQHSLLTYGLDDFIEACTRPSYRQPVSEIWAKYEPAFTAAWVSDGPALGFVEPEPGRRRLRSVRSAEERGATWLMQITNLLNTS